MTSKPTMKIRCATTVIGILAVALVLGMGSAASAIEPDAPKTIDEQFVEVNERVPGFGGAYFENGNLHVWLVDPSEQALEDARQALAELVDERYATGRLVAHEADFTFRELHNWRRAGADVHNLPGVVFTDVDEKANRLTIGVTDSEHNGARVVEAFSRAGVPEKAVRIIESDPIVAEAAPVGPGRSGPELPGDEAGGFERRVAPDDRRYLPIVLVGTATVLMALFALWRRNRHGRESLQR